MKTLLGVIKADDDGQLLADKWDSELHLMCVRERERGMRECSHCCEVKVSGSDPREHLLNESFCI